MVMIFTSDWPTQAFSRYTPPPPPHTHPTRLCACMCVCLDATDKCVEEVHNSKLGNFIIWGQKSGKLKLQENSVWLAEWQRICCNELWVSHSHTHTLTHSHTHTLIHSYTHTLTHSHTHIIVFLELEASEQVEQVGPVWGHTWILHCQHRPRKHKDQHTELQHTDQHKDQHTDQHTELQHTDQHKDQHTDQHTELQHSDQHTDQLISRHEWHYRHAQKETGWVRKREIVF